MTVFYKNLEEIDTLYDKAFYGLKMDSQSSLSIDVIRTNDSSPVVLPEDGFIKDPDGYKQYFWTADAITFRMNKNTGHLELVIL
jgi:hypothetical protein|tara:strand:+ start:545 stop:796 length:252 start_codon:yes stop_codon:yes gene_type:complete